MVVGSKQQTWKKGAMKKCNHQRQAEEEEEASSSRSYSKQMLQKRMSAGKNRGMMFMSRVPRQSRAEHYSYEGEEVGGWG